MGEFGVCSDDSGCGGAEAASFVWGEGGSLYCGLSLPGVLWWLVVLL